MEMLAARLWDRTMDMVLERATGHKFNRHPTPTDPLCVRCKYCGVDCFTVMDRYKAETASRCPAAPAEVSK